MLNAATIISEAEQRAGQADSDTSVRTNLERLVDSLQRTGGLSPEGEAMTLHQFVAENANRIEAQRWLQEHPEVADEVIASPLFLEGLPRSGTTYFQYLFDRDERFRLIRTWQSMMPNPPPGFDPQSVERRKTQFMEALKARPTFEGFDSMHLYDADGSDECHAFLQQSYGAAGLHNLFNVPEYFDYLLDELDLVASYRIHKRQLQLLQWKLETKPWALKYPNHVIGMNEILEVYPDARFLMTHRDPVQTLASICKMTFNLRSMRSAEPVDPHEVGRQMRYFIRRHIDRIMAFDRGEHAGRVVHVDYYSLVKDPVAEMRRIHAGVGIETPDAVAEAVGAWHRDNPKNARGSNDYTIEQWGLDAGQVAEEYSDYIQRFGIPREAEGLARIAG
ncbi:sulfotransferase family protein [Haliea sp. E17]|uniref:sulfotransferase family protein n=1 Tax=Haliea sp. E17 TaxID=3401576 RepID=UPI003AACEEBE